jgi:hypothetical protein
MILTFVTIGIALLEICWCKMLGTLFDAMYFMPLYGRFLYVYGGGFVICLHMYVRTHHAINEFSSSMLENPSMGPYAR